MRKIISDIVEALEKQGVSETELAKKAGLQQKTVNNLLAGRTKKLDFQKIAAMRAALGLDLTGERAQKESPVEVGGAEWIEAAHVVAKLGTQEDRAETVRMISKLVSERMRELSEKL